MKNLFDPAFHSQSLRYSDAQAQTSFSGRASPGVDQESDLHSSIHKLTSEDSMDHRLKDLNGIIQQRTPWISKTIKEKKPIHKVHTIPGTNYPIPPHWDPPPPPINPLTNGDGGWPANLIPVEIFEHVGNSLSRDDLLNMRLVNHEFEAKISSRIFQTVVVPFKSDIYGVAGSDAVEINSIANSAGRDSRKAKGIYLTGAFACSY